MGPSIRERRFSETSSRADDFRDSDLIKENNLKEDTFTNQNACDSPKEASNADLEEQYKKDLERMKKKQIEEEMEKMKIQEMKKQEMLKKQEELRNQEHLRKIEELRK